LHSGLSDDDVQIARDTLAELANRTIFSKTYFKDDPLVNWYSVRPGDTLARIAKRANISEALLVQLNNFTNKNIIRQGARIKVPQGPFHATISKHAHEMFVYLQNLHVRTLRVALGEGGSTPTGRWKIANQLQNPGWQDPRTGQRWHPDDPGNPIGEYWLGLEGVEGDAVGQFGYGIHGTIEPETIGQDVSLGCVRLDPVDMAWFYTLMLPGQSYILITE